MADLRNREPGELYNLEIGEVSLVTEGANDEGPFLTIKSAAPAASAPEPTPPAPAAEPPAATPAAPAAPVAKAPEVPPPAAPPPAAADAGTAPASAGAEPPAGEVSTYTQAAVCGVICDSMDRLGEIGNALMALPPSDSSTEMAIPEEMAEGLQLVIANLETILERHQIGKLQKNRRGFTRAHWSKILAGAPHLMAFLNEISGLYEAGQAAMQGAVAPAADAPTGEALAKMAAELAEVRKQQQADSARLAEVTGQLEAALDAVRKSRAPSNASLFPVGGMSPAAAQNGGRVHFPTVINAKKQPEK